ncbi:DUF1128 domain-containing protein [Staphylococcus gallinarum]|uniref:DUF1128 family protein n=1 Tax=Staphylococcus gallinarum TaxID=1293 RepID=UPI0015FB0835|nr:DUF1128 family protein [Staphylococcus gallinarum]MCD8822009.1 DUF1128 domain-containing protein [Staphylococcus gallinarum]MCD8872371.1 DUF1128 domain-containing protein [Staphylococcus gallinarum]MCQ9289498.1 DUF1128 domain-containing protein [Staphylococcus gallinarum]MCW0986416.1 DUF1128 domain-containing protein [Staphylococcus gallinarum]
MIEEIREKLNLVNQSLIDPEKYKTANEEEVQEIHEYVTSKDSFTPSETTAIADALGQLRK